MAAPRSMAAATLLILSDESGNSDTMDVGNTCAYLTTPYARRLSGETLYVDGRVNIMA